MQGFVQGADRQQTTLLPECLDDWVDESNSIRAVDVFVDALELRDLGFDGVTAISTGSNRAGGWSARLAAISR
jgi:transposase